MGGDEAAEALAAGAAALDLRLPSSGSERLLAFLAELRRWNRAYNLVAPGTPLAWVRLHLLDSLSVAPLLGHLIRQDRRFPAANAGPAGRTPSSRFDSEPAPVSATPPAARNRPRGPLGPPPWHLGTHATRTVVSSELVAEERPPAFPAPGQDSVPSRASRPPGPPRVLDFGTGAGLPGIPLAISLPELRFVLLDGNGKKVRFCRQAVAVLGLGNVDVVQARVEDLAPAVPFDAAVTRAVGSLARIHGLIRPHCRGPILAMKGRRPARELAELGGSTVELVPLHVPGLEAARHLAILR